jgi:hypothetical protein
MSPVREHAEVDKNIINDYFIFMNLYKSFDSGIGKNKRKDTHSSGIVDSSNPRPRRRVGGFATMVVVFIW